MEREKRMDFDRIARKIRMVLFLTQGLNSANLICFHSARRFNLSQLDVLRRRGS